MIILHQPWTLHLQMIEYINVQFLLQSFILDIAQKYTND